MPKHKSKKITVEQNLKCPFGHVLRRPILLQKFKYDGTLHTTCHREIVIEAITKFFYYTCKDKILNPLILLAMKEDSFPWILAELMEAYDVCDDISWTLIIHKISYDFPNDYIAVLFFKAALMYKIDTTYRQFLCEHKYRQFLPTDLESVD